MSEYPSFTLPNFITGFVCTASLEQKQCLLQLLTEDINSHLHDNCGGLSQPLITEPSLQSEASDLEAPLVCESSINNDLCDTDTTNVSNTPYQSELIEHIPELSISKEHSSGLLNELSSLKLRSRGYNGKPAKVKTQWLSPNSLPYSYGNIVNKPKPMTDFPNIGKLMELVNSHPSTSGDMSSCLVSCMSTPRSSLNYHADNEELIAQDSDICTFSIGPARSLDFIPASGNIGRKSTPPPPEFSVPAGNHSLNIMHPGCQQNFLHRVPPGTETGTRFSLSFRRIVLPSTSSRDLANDFGNPTPPVPDHNTQDHKTPRTKHVKKVTLLAGDSYFARLDKNKLSKGKEEVFNIAKGGRKISQVLQDIECFVHDNPDLEVKTLFLSVGTNDIRNCQQGIDHLRPVLTYFMKSVKSLFPSARIFIQSLLPIPANGNPKAEKNVISINCLIYNLCSRYKLFFIDVFSSFLNKYGNRNLNLFPAFDNEKKMWDIHPNNKGMGVLARHYIFLIHSRWFNPMGY